MISAELTMVIAPSAKPNPAPNTRPPRISTKKISSNPAVPALSGRRIVPTAASTPSIARVRASIRPPVISARTTASTIGSTSANTIGACSGLIPESGRRNSGQANATAPRIIATATAGEIRRDAGPVSGWGCRFIAAPGRGRPV